MSLSLNSVNFYIKLIMLPIATILIVLGFLLIKKSIQSDLNYLNNNPIKKKSVLEKKGFKIRVDFDKCEILTSKVILSKEPRNSLLQFYNNLFLSSENSIQTEIFLIKLKFIAEISNKHITFISEPLKIDIKSLEIHFYEHKSTYLYVNKHNFDNFYFDLDFLNSYKHHEKSFLF